MVSFGFGLIHGLGFAGALREIGLPEGDIPLALFAFNIGVELGQIPFIVLALGVFAGYGMGNLASFWVIQRVSSF